jgi:DNA repair protein RecO (recombination protein O)
MSALVTDAIVLHAFDYLETSRIVRLMTREAGVQSVIARGARSSRKRFGTSVDLFAQGTVEIHIRPNRELQSMASFEATRARPQFARAVGRFTAGSMIAELALRASSDESAQGMFESVELALDNLAMADPADTVTAGLAGAWHIMATLGFTPSLDSCANCHAEIESDADAQFSHSSGGALCSRCGSLASGTRSIPASARDALREWMSGSTAPRLTAPESRAHQRLFREFFLEHLGDNRELKAYGVWEHGAWSAA